MRELVMSYEDGVIVSDPIEVSLTIRGAVKLVAEVCGEDIGVFNDLLFRGLEARSVTSDGENGHYKEFGDLPCAVVTDDEKKTFYLVMGDTDEEGHDLLLSVHYVGRDDKGGSIFLNLGGESLAKFWQRAKTDLIAHKEQAVGVDAKALELATAVLRFASGERIDIAPAFNDWMAAAGRKGGVELVNQLAKAA